MLEAFTKSKCPVSFVMAQVKFFYLQYILSGSFLSFSVLGRYRSITRNSVTSSGGLAGRAYRINVPSGPLLLGVFRFDLQQYFKCDLLGKISLKK